jgi:hypothetical protein
MKKEELCIEGQHYTFDQVVDAFVEEESESFKLKFLETMFLSLLDERHFCAIDELKLFPNMEQLVHLREHFIISLTSFYEFEYKEEDFNILCKWQRLASELLLKIVKNHESKEADDVISTCSCCEKGGEA